MKMLETIYDKNAGFDYLYFVLKTVCVEADGQIYDYLYKYKYI